jgi:hypothetical protein
MTYKEYLKTTEWAVLRRIKLQEANHRCQVCNGDGKLHVHHRTYERVRCELLSDLVVLCAGCHEHFHFRDQPEPDMSYKFQLDDGSVGRLKDQDLEQWKQSLPHVDVDRVLQDLQEYSRKKPFEKKSWFMKVGAILGKEQERSEATKVYTFGEMQG